MDLNAIAEYLPLFGEAALLTVKLGVSLFRHPCRTAPFPRKGEKSGLPPLLSKEA